MAPPARRLVAICIVLVGAPFLAGAVGRVQIPTEIIGPLITVTLWLAAFIVRAVRVKAGVAFFEWLAVIGCLAILQLLLDLHTPYLGDLVIAVLHAAGAIALLVRHRVMERQAAKPPRSE